MIQKKNVLNTVPVICLGALLLGSAYGLVEAIVCFVVGTAISAALKKALKYN